MAKTAGKKVDFLTKNCSARGGVESISPLSNTGVIFLPPNTTAKMQPCHAGILTSMKSRYRSLQLDHLFDLSDAGVEYIYNVDVLTAMKSFAKI